MWTIAYKGKALGKPMDRVKAEAMIMRLQGALTGLELVEVEVEG